LCACGVGRCGNGRPRHPESVGPIPESLSLGLGKRTLARISRLFSAGVTSTVQSASDMLYALISSDMIEALTGDRQWSTRRLAAHLALLFRNAFAPRHA
jgi:hypothetical protein